MFLNIRDFLNFNKDTIKFLHTLYTYYLTLSWFLVDIHQTSNIKKRVVKKYYKSKEFVLKLSSQLNRSLGCIKDLDSYVSLEGLQFLLEELQDEGFAILIHKKLHYEKFVILVYKNCTMKGSQF